MKSGGHSNGKDNDEVMQGIVEASGSHDQGTNGDSNQRSESERWKTDSQRLLMGDHGTVIKELMLTVSQERIIVRCWGVIIK